jgi:hypothetical protein
MDPKTDTGRAGSQSRTIPSSSGQAHDHGTEFPESYSMDNIVLGHVNLESSTRRLSTTSLLSATSSQPGPSKETVLRKASKIITHHTLNLQNRLNTRIRQSRYHGWRMGVLFGCCMSLFVLCCNIVIVVIASQLDGGFQDGIANLITGPATTISRWSTAFHLLINIFSTMLLGASNYVMQVLSSPTRKDINTAHAAGKWCDIGILSTRNLRNISRRRTALWCLLAFSSIPLHLL